MAKQAAKATSATPARACWECGAAVAGEHFCPACGKIQPQAPASTYFDFFGLLRKLGLDLAALEKQFHQLSWKLHPDNFHNASSYERELSLEKAAVLNDAYRALRDPVERAEYLLGLEGVRREGEIKQQAPPDLLEEVFELNEQLEELRAARRAGTDPKELDDLRHRLEKARAGFQEKLDAVLAEFAAQFARWDALLDAKPGETAARRKTLDKMSEILNRHSYVRNLVRNVSEELES